MKKIYFCISLFLISLPHFSSAVTYTWNTYVAGNLSYTNGNMSTTITGTAFDTRGPQDPNGGANSGYKSPKYISTATINTYQGGFTNDYGMPGLVVGHDWTNLTSSTVVTMTFAVPVGGPVSFNLYDINTGSWGGNDPVWIDKITIAGTDCGGTVVYPVVTGCSNNVSGANNNIITGNGNCTNNTNTITFNSPSIKTITITYSSGSPLSSGYGNDPDPQYIIVSDITASALSLLTLTNNNPSITCTSSTVTLSATSSIGGAAYSWAGPNSANPAGTTPNNSSTVVSAIGTYTVTVTDVGNGCSASASVSVTQNINLPGASIATPSTITCTNQNVTLSASSATSGVNYSWSSGGSAATTSVSAIGIYTVTVINPANNCSSSATVSVSQNTTAPNASIGTPAQLNCANSSVTLTASSTTLNATYAWSGGGTSSTKTTSTAGTYVVTVTDPVNGCTASASVTVTSSGTGVTTSTNFTNATCGNSNGIATVTASGGSGSYTYNWSNSQTASSATNLAAGTYLVTVTSGSCSATASVSVGSTSGLTLNTSFTSTTCGNNNGNAHVTVTGGSGTYTYNWSNSNATDSVSNLSAATYTITVNDNAGCSASATVIIDSTSLSNVHITPANNIMCAGDSIQVCLDNTYTSYLWSNGAVTQCIYAHGAGNYYVTVTDNGNCTTTSNHATIQVYPLPPVSISVNGDTLTSYNANSYQWYLNGGIINGANGHIYIAHQTGNYTVAITDSNGCIVFSNPVTVGGTVGINKLNEESTVNIFPNPLEQGNWMIEVKEILLGSELKIFDNNGRLAFETAITYLKFEIPVQFARGVYFLQIRNQETLLKRKLIRL